MTPYGLSKPWSSIAKSTLLAEVTRLKPLADEYELRIRLRREEMVTRVLLGMPPLNDDDTVE